MKGCHCIHADTEPFPFQLLAARPTILWTDQSSFTADYVEENLYIHVDVTFLCTVTHRGWGFLDARPHTERRESSSVPSWYTATQLIQLSLSAISLLHSICLVWPNAHTHTHSTHTYTHTLLATHTYLHETENKNNNKGVFFKTILLY